MRLPLVVVAVAACGPGLARQDMRPLARNALVGASGDADKIERMLDGAVTDGGLWFADPTCSAHFPGAGEVRPAHFHEFAACLAGLHWQASTRNDELGDVVVMTYEPGFEIEARVVQEAGGPRIAWIGYESRRDDSDGLATISTATLETLRASGDRNGPLDPDVANHLELDEISGAHAAFAWLKVCIDENGAVTRADARAMTSTAAAEAFSKAAMAWTFRPFAAAGRLIPVCVMVRPVFPAGRGPEVETLPLPAPPSRTKVVPVVFAAGAKLVEAHRIHGEKYIMPDDSTKTAMQQAGVGRVIGSFRLCLDDVGHVESILLLHSTGFASYDRRLIAGIQRWVYSPFLINGTPAPVCTAATFVYSQN